MSECGATLHVDDDGFSIGKLRRILHVKCKSMWESEINMQYLVYFNYFHFILRLPAGGVGA